MPLINCEIYLQLKWSKNCILVADTAANQNAEFKITDKKLYVPVRTLSTQDNIKLLKQLKSGFKRTINWNKYLPRPANRVQNKYLYFLIDPRFQGVNRLFVLSFKDDVGGESHKQYYLPTVEITNCNVMIDGKNFFDHLIKNDLKAYDIIRNIGTGKGDDYTRGCLLDYPYFKKYSKLTAIDLNKQQNLDADAKTIQKYNFTENLGRGKCFSMLFIIEEAKETALDF